MDDQAYACQTAGVLGPGGGAQVDPLSCQSTEGQWRNAGQMPPCRGSSGALTPSSSNMSTTAPAGLVNRAGPGVGQMSHSPSTINALPGIMSNGAWDTSPRSGMGSRRDCAPRF
ncbi:hypothetical protein VP01_4339g2 [Puccinia sorghi]|uniref:Uncharacterized protein n=1 Tax=Puccinia sorghi TaxID=27349 RepID=A0A0L6UPX9_9BASI|nr:hypothetical protein VP01_4339g2 [Puccinia sorghi]